MVIVPVNLRSSHRKFCPYLASVRSGDSEEEGWKVLLERILEALRNRKGREADTPTGQLRLEVRKLFRRPISLCHR